MYTNDQTEHYPAMQISYIRNSRTTIQYTLAFGAQQFKLCHRLLKQL
eukprot:SAG31_NODE_43339_length_267_cov_0.934524_1_plen_46_part_10